MSTMTATAKTLLCLGMEDGAAAKIVGNDLRIVGGKEARWRWLTARPGPLYAIHSEGKVLFIGRAFGTLSKRLASLQAPATGSHDEIIYRGIRKVLSIGKEVRIFVLPIEAPLSWCGFSVDLAAGIERSLVRFFEPPWNSIQGGVFLTETEINGQAN